MFAGKRWLGLLLLLSACAAEPATKQGSYSMETAPPPVVQQSADAGMMPVAPDMTPPSMTMDPPGVQIPFDTRVATQATTPPPPISGGTLLVTRDGRYVVAADPDRDRVSIVELADSGSLSATIALDAGDEPGRVVEDGSGLVHVALRRAGMIASIDVAAGTLVARRPVCAAPRGLAFEAGTDSLLIACAGGELVRMKASPSNLEPASEIAHVEPDLRDVALTDGGAFVSRFKRAELLAVTGDGTVLASRRPVFPTRESSVAWRTARASDGRVLMLHQIALSTEIEVGTQSVVATTQGGAYGGGTASALCESAVVSALTMFTPDGEVLVTQALSGVLPVDFALDENAMQVAVVFAGASDDATPLRTAPPHPTPSPGLGGAGAAAAPLGPRPNELSVMLFDLHAFDAGPGTGQCLPPIGGLKKDLAFEPVAVASGNGGFIVQTREPAYLISFDAAGMTNTVALEGDSVLDTGHTLFHHDAGAGVACASCHAEGAEDGHVWRFSDTGPRRTQALHVGLAGTAPFHWAGDMTGVSALMEEVLVKRMGGVHESPDRTAALEHWLFSLHPPAAMRSADDPAALRGRALFQGSAECAKCHNGEKLTNNHNEDVGTGESVQVPSLVGVGYRGPWLHTGCANTLRDRFDPACGGDQHGKTAELSDAELDDLVAYLQTL